MSLAERVASRVTEFGVNEGRRALNDALVSDVRQLEADLAEAVALLRRFASPLYPVSAFLDRLDARKVTTAASACRQCDWALAAKPCDGCPDPSGFDRARKRGLKIARAK